MNRGMMVAAGLLVAAAVICAATAGFWFQHRASHGWARHPEANAIGTLRTLCTAQALFREGDKDRDGVLDYAGSLDDIVRAGLMAPRRCRFPGCGWGGESHDDFVGYRFEVLRADNFTWSARADPTRPGRTGDRYFFIDESGVIRFSATGPATARSTAVGG